MQSERLLIRGELRGAEGDKTYETLNPATGQPLGTAADASLADADAAIAAARTAFDTTGWSRDHAFRASCLRQLHHALVDHTDELRQMIIDELGAPVMLTDGPQLASPVNMVAWHSDLLDRYEWTEDLGEAEVMGRSSRRWTEKEAVGVAAAIVPYNYPIQISLAKVAPALAAGCTVVLKGPPEAPWLTASLGSLIAEHTDIPAGVVNVLTGADHQVGAVLTTDPRVDMVSFTGSTATGRRIMAAAAGTVKKTFLELGGKSACIVLDDADVGLSAMVAGFTICSHAGQGCAITSRLLVPEAKLAEYVDAVAETLQGIPYGDPNDPGTMMGPLISAQQREKVDGYVQRAAAAGGKIVTGGRVPEHLADGFFYEPTLVAGLDNSAEIAQDELFGPALVILPYRDEDDAVAIANDSIYGLSGTVFSDDEERATAVARRLRTGTVSVNGGMWYGPDVPFGGYRQSGIGREMGVEGFEEYLETKALALPTEG